MIHRRERYADPGRQAQASNAKETRRLTILNMILEEEDG
jgi:hypothetical protein